MALKTIVKVGEINNLSDARYCAGMGVEMLGFNLQPKSENYISPEKFKEIAGWVAGVKFVGEFGAMDAENIISIIKDYELDYIETACMDEVSTLCSLHIPLILTLNDANFDNKKLHQSAKYFEFILIQDDNESSILLQKVKEDPIFKQHKTLIGSWFDTTNLNAWIEDEGIQGIAMKGGNEIKPGIKDFDELADILEVLEIDEPY